MVFKIKKQKQSHHTPRCFSRGRRGFTIVELMVTISFFVIISSVVLVRHATFSSNLLLTNLAYDIALSIREAQVFGLSVSEFGTGTGEFDVGYGIHIDSGDNISYILFADREPKNQRYDDNSEIVDVFNIHKGNTISLFCGVLSNGTEKCSPTNISYLDIVFERPNPDAIITSSITGESYSSAKIVVRSPQGKERTIIIGITGQIYVEPLP